MCGFAGELAVGRRADVEAVARMAATMGDRGPDGAGAWAQDAVALGHRRLKIIDLSQRGAQPMTDPELGLTIVFNGIVYNHHELRAELEGLGHRFFSTADTEVLLKGYAQWGAGVVERLKGMFALALVERDSGTLFLARDRLGIKPLYLADTSDGALRFASTLPALLAGGGIDTAIDPVALHHYFSWHAVVPPPRTILRGVQKLPPATTLTVTAGGERTERRYWRAPFSRRMRDAGMSEHEWEDALLDALRTAVRRRMVSDVPVGVLLSGGLDSSLIVALLDEQGQHGLATFSVGFEDGGGREGDEFRYSDLVARRYGTEHRQIAIATGELVEALPDAIAAMSEPMVSHDAVAFYLLSREVSRTRKVVQSGQGADEVLGGYSWYQDVAAGMPYERAFFDRPHDVLSASVGEAYRLAEDPSQAFVTGHFGAPGADTPVDRALRLDTEVMLVDDPVKRVDNMTMAWGLEARVPFLDHDLVELAAACPPELKLAEGGKGVLKRAARRVLPAEVVDRPKGYFPVPALTHLEGRPLELVTDALRSAAARDRALLDPGHVDALLAEPNAHRTALDGSVLWQVGLLECWLQARGV